MIYDYEGQQQLKVEPIVDFNKNTPKEVLQYAVGSLLYSPATNNKIAEKILTKKIPFLKSIALCLEDAIGSGQVKEAELCLKNTLKELKEYGTDKGKDLPLIFIRVREPRQIWRLYRNCGSLLELVCGFLIPKFDKDNMQDYIENFHKVKEKLESPIYILPIIESTKAIYQQNRTDNLLQIREGLEQIHNEVLNVRVGGADFCNIYGIRRKNNQMIWDIKVVANCLADIINMFSRDFVVSGAVWEYFGDIESHNNWTTGLIDELTFDKLNGMVGKTCIHPSQLKYVQESLIVLEEDYNDATQIINASAIDCGVIKSNGKGKMNELRTHINWAKKIVNLASVYGVK